MWRDIMNINNNLLNEKINQLKKGLELLGQMKIYTIKLMMKL